MVGTCASRPPLQRIDNHQPECNRLTRTHSVKLQRSCGLHHGFQMDLKQAVQLEKQELRRLGLVPPPVAVEAPKIAAPEEEEDGSQTTSTPPYWLYARQKLVRKAASFSSSLCRSPPPPPCSPPVPIPQRCAVQRRYSAAAGLGDHLARGVDAEQFQQLSRSQCEARLWDEFWNYKLSFESRESFEVLKVSGKGGTRARAYSDQTGCRAGEARHCADNNEEECVGPETHVSHYGDVFEMDL
ncbi:hypothetical protein PHYBOEH_009246 [Phytophthora boehmeriae]|uniref:Uncharacterized protein n=1 Tax=Phytophthora boehmeriae TaxID=109152 RepID=A0A8T1VYI1_9STRA|nr:hypothetical protein PHYBOEH_009246 [Phytophthora boehmeriae]